MAQQPRPLDPQSSPQAFFGATVRAWRTRRALSLAQLGQVVHVSGDLLGKIEKAQRRALPDLVEALDKALGARGEVSRAGQACGDHGSRTRATGDAVAAGCRPAGVAALAGLRAVVLGGPFPLDSAEPAGRAPTMAGQMLSLEDVAALWREYQASRFDEVASKVPAVLIQAHTDLRLADAPAGHREAARILAWTYHLAAAIATKLGGRDLAWVCADRGLLAAQGSEDPQVLASLLRGLAHVQLAGGNHVAAADLVSRTVDRFSPVLDGDPVGCCLLGSLHLVGAMAAARGGDAPQAWTSLRWAQGLAERLGHDANHAWTAFGPTNLAVHELSVAVELDDLDAATAYVHQIDTSPLPIERRVRHTLEQARVLTLIGNDLDGVHLVHTAARLAPAHVRHHYLTH